MAKEHFAKFPVVRIDAKEFVTVPRNSSGFAVWGPYQLLEPGEYDVTFEIEPLEYDTREKACCRIDVAANSGKQVLLQQRLSVGDLIDRRGEVLTTFEVRETSRVEYRVGATGDVNFRVAYHRRAYPVALRGLPLPLDQNPLYAENSDRMIALEAGGIRFAADGGVLVAKVHGLDLEVQSVEDLQVLNEVFLANHYTVVLPRRSIAIDIGMNVGFASLALARNPDIETVFSYEPFATPFRRAARNFERNSGFSAKIHPTNCGLADRNEVLEIKSSPDTTISVSIRGVKTGELERIRIMDAAIELGPKLRQAVDRGLGVIMKVDCEGSEFAIFESLKRASLFDKIEAFMIEWHKWWSADKTQADLITPLHDAGFIVFDRTNPVNPHAGFLQAVRSANRNGPQISA